MTAIDELFSKGVPVAVCIWNEQQTTPAQAYIDAAKSKYPEGDAIISVTKNETLRNGDTLHNRTVIRYHFTGASSGRGY